MTYKRAGGPSAPVFLTGKDGVSIEGNYNFNAIVPDAGWTVMLNAVRLDDAPTSANSALVDVSGKNKALVELFIDSTLAPTTVTFTPQFTTDGGNTYSNYLVGIWASMVFEDTQTAAGLRQTFILDVAGIDQWRMNVVAAGTDATKFFDVTVKTRAFN